MTHSTYHCNHIVYTRCTLFKEDFKGLAIIQQRYASEIKATYWTELDPWLIQELYSHPKFDEYFQQRAREADHGLYPTVTIRQVMWALRMKPLRRAEWETYFDRKEI